ncbi:MAG: acyl-CoA dehydrogenase [Burkholderiales bacterium]|nr:acyl-CoA dehydrogenase [Burkholderiales bacterium]
MLNSERALGETIALPSEEERQLLRDSVRGFLGEHWPAASAVERSTRASARREIWKGLANQGLASLGSQPLEGGLHETVVAMQEMGRAACPAPLADAVLVNLLLRGSREFLELVHRGDAYPCFCLAEADPEPAAGVIRLDGSRASGRVAFVEGADSATHFVLLANGGSALAVISADAPGVHVRPTPAMGIDGLFEIDFDASTAWSVPIDPAILPEIVAVSRLLVGARAWGAADRSFELVVDYVKQRRQFGQPVGRFQALQHKLANNLIALTGIRLGLEAAARHFDRGVAQWHLFSSAVWAYESNVLRKVSLETHHAFGAIGYAEEHEAPRHFRRVHFDMSRHGGPRAAREDLADRYLGEQPQGFPEFDLGEAGNAFRRDVRLWLSEHWPAERRRAYEATDQTHREFDADFARELGATGWLGLTWPKRFGGMERTPYEMLALLEELERFEAPRAGAPIQAAAWMIHGSPEQQARYLPGLLSGEAFYGMWYSEPDSGSDLASLRTTAVRDGEHWIINGQKIWTTTYWAEYMWLAARTDATAKPAHAGISMFLVRSDTPGIVRKPMRTMYGGEFCNTFLDNVRVPADALVGKENGGWQVLTGSLGTERAYVGSRITARLARDFEQVCNYIRTLEIDGKPARLDPVVRNMIGDVAAHIEIGRQLALYSIDLYARGIEPTWEAAMAKVFAGELMERFCEETFDIIGMRATLSSGNPDAPMLGKLEQKLRHSLMWVISIGTNEIQRTLIAQRGLGLPR